MPQTSKPSVRAQPQGSVQLRRSQIAAFFRERRLASGLTAQQVSEDLGLANIELLLSYEAGSEPIPLDEIFALTNLLNIPPEDVLTLICDVYTSVSSLAL